MFENDTHALGSIDRALQDNMIKLCPDTMGYLYSGYTPTISHYEKGSRPKLEKYAEKIISDNSAAKLHIKAIAQFTSNLRNNAEDNLDLMQFGGTEEEIIKRGSDWCTDVARVAVALCQIAGYPTRIIHLFDITRAYSGHEIIEVYSDKTWGAVDPLRNVVYHSLKGYPVSVWNLMNNHQLIKDNYIGDQSSTLSVVGQFSGVAISNYFIRRIEDYNYTISKINSYYRSILENSNCGWPSGLRWIHGEDK
jgi:hypothetical protein